MKVFKFGGASIKDANAIRNIGPIIASEEELVVVVSAMGKTTNLLEKVVDAFFNEEQDAFSCLNAVKKFHTTIMDDLFDKNDPIYDEVHNLFVEIEWEIEDEPQRSYDYVYDQIVSVGELLSTKIISAYLQKSDIPNNWLDARNCIQTDNTYRAAVIDWDLTSRLVQQQVKGKITITQGFIGSSSENFTTTLGREGSDFSASIFAYCLDAASVTIWKDVPGVLNADPHWFDTTEKLAHISYHEAVELAYYGATIIHPKTIKPLQNKSIPLYVKSFLTPTEKGTIIDHNTTNDALIPSFIFKVNQLLLSIAPKDYSFIIENNLSEIFALFATYKISVNLMQHSAISFSVCVNNEKEKVTPLIKELQKNYKVLYNDNLELVTIRHYDQSTIDKITEGKELLVEQKSRHTARMVMRTIAEKS